jgi:hypothetical protein
MVGRMDALTVPPPDEIRQRIVDCEVELKALQRLLRMSVAAQKATEARLRRPDANCAKEVPRAS